MKIWSDSLSYLNSIREGYVSYVERILVDECTNDCSPDDPVNDNREDRSHYNADSALYNENEIDCNKGSISYHNAGFVMPNEEEKDCNLIGTYYNARTHFPLDQEHVFRLARHRLQLASTLHIQACDASHWLICNPVEAGNIAVIDEEAHSLLGSFRTPTTLQEITVTRESSIARLLAVILLFV